MKTMTYYFYYTLIKSFLSFIWQQGGISRGFRRMEADQVTEFYIGRQLFLFFSYLKSEK